MKSRIGYRIWQFLKSFDPPPSQEKLDRIRLYLSPVEMIMFTKMPYPDQNHSLRVFESINASEVDEDLIKASLLHDIGKGQYPLNRWERIFSVMIQGLFPRIAIEWEKGEPKGIKRPLVVLGQHQRWGADMAREAGCSPKVVWLIENHELGHPPESDSEYDNDLLYKLQNIDNLN